MKDKQPSNLTPTGAPAQGAPRFSARAAEIAAIVRPLPATINRDPFPKPRKTLHLPWSDAPAGGEEISGASAAGIDGKAK